VAAATEYRAIEESVLFKEKKFERQYAESRWQPFGPLGPVPEPATEPPSEAAPKPPTAEGNQGAGGAKSAQ
jgi:hypothetical protein